MLSLLFFLQTIEKPTTVNGQELGAVADYRTEGPARVCLANVAIDLKEGEQAYLQYSGIHHASMIVVTGKKPVEFFHRDSGASLSGDSSLHGWTEGNFSRWQSNKAGKVSYTFVGHDDNEIDGVYFGSLRVSSDYFLEATDEKPDIEDWHFKFVERIKIYDGDAKSCATHYRYGWKVIMGEAPLVVRGESEKK